jgi:hypothetical protein
MTINLQITFEALVGAISSIDPAEKRKLLELLETQLFEQEEAAYTEDADTLHEMQAVKAEYEAGECTTFDGFLTSGLSRRS